MAKIILTRGIPASGKTTAAIRWQAESPETRMRLNRDDARMSMFGKLSGLTDQQEAMITRFHMDQARYALTKGIDVIVDATNLTNHLVKPWFKVGPVEFWDFPIDVNEAIGIDGERDKRVGVEVMRKFARKVNKDGTLKPPPAPPTIPEFEKYAPVKGQPPAIVVDIDGTLARIVSGGRSPYDYSRVHEDEVIEHVASLVRRLATSQQVIILSGRDDDCREQTAAWLRAKGIPFDRLYMRATGDTRDDAIVKYEFFRDYIAPNANVTALFDDRLRVRRMWHAIGAPLFSIGDPDANF